MSTCLRCHLPRDRHPVSGKGDLLCLHYVEPAPRWMKVVTWLGARITR